MKFGNYDVNMDALAYTHTLSDGTVTIYFVGGQTLHLNEVETSQYLVALSRRETFIRSSRNMQRRR